VNDLTEPTHPTVLEQIEDTFQKGVEMVKELFGYRKESADD